MKEDERVGKKNEEYTVLKLVKTNKHVSIENRV